MTKKSNTERVQNENKNMTHIDQNQSKLLHKNIDNASTKENAENSDDNSSTNSRDTNSKSKKAMVILGDSILKHLNSWEISKKTLRKTVRFLPSTFQSHLQIAWRIILNHLCEKSQIIQSFMEEQTS